MLRIGRDIAMNELAVGMAVICNCEDKYTYTHNKAVCIIKDLAVVEGEIFMQVVATAEDYSSQTWRVCASNFDVIETEEELEEIIHNNRMDIPNKKLRKAFVFNCDYNEKKEVDNSTLRYLQSACFRSEDKFDFDINCYTATISKDGVTIEVTQDNTKKLEVDNLVGLAYLLYLNKIQKNNVYTDNKVEEYLKKNPKYKVRVVGV